MRIPILMYHRIGEAHNNWERKYCVTPTQFKAHMSRLAADGWRALSLHEFFDWLEHGVSPSGNPFLLTFDDGFLGLHAHAADVLTHLGWPATVFLVSGLIGRTDEWCVGHNPSGETYPLLSSMHIRELATLGFTFQSHTRTHADLPSLSDHQLNEELRISRAELATLLGHSVDYLAYPYGHHDERVIRLTRDAGYRAAFSVQPGFNRVDVDRFRLRRLDVFGSDSEQALARKINLGSNDGSLWNTLHYRGSRILARLGLN